MSFSKTTIQIVTWNSLKFLPECLKSIFDQTDRDFQVLVIDNNSQDGTVDFLKKNYPEVGVFQNKRNVGFAHAHNQGIKLLNSPFVLIMNPDIILENDFLEKIMAEAENEARNEYGLFGGKLLKLKILDLEFNQVEKTEIIDSCGLKIKKNHQVTELGAGEASGNFFQVMEVFGHSGALAFFKREALQNVFLPTKNNLGGEYFDEDFFVYKEDVDLSWRLRLAGYKALFIPEAKAYHYRTMASPVKSGFLALIKHRQRQSRIFRLYSYRNHFLLLFKDEFFINLIKYFPGIFWQELKKFIYVLFFEWSSLKAIPQALALLPRMIGKRRLIMKKTKLKASEMAKWLN